MKRNRYKFCRNFTHECYFKINFKELNIEIIYDFEDSHPSIDHLSVSLTFAYTILDLLFEIDPITYHQVRKSALNRMNHFPRNYSDNVRQYPAQKVNIQI